MKEIDVKISHRDIWPVWYKRFWWTITFRRKKYRKKLKAVWTVNEPEDSLFREIEKANREIRKNMEEHSDDVHDFRKMY